MLISDEKMYRQILPRYADILSRSLESDHCDVGRYIATNFTTVIGDVGGPGVIGDDIGTRKVSADNAY